VTSTDGVGSGRGDAAASGGIGIWLSPFCVDEGGILPAVDGLGGEPVGGTAKELFPALGGPNPLLAGALGGVGNGG
jgi:hypothetical protein